MVQEHDATAHHYDLRLEVEGRFRCWAVPKGPSLDPAQPRLAAPTPDHDLDVGDFEGVRRGGRRGSGAVILWDRGTWSPPEAVAEPERELAEALERGHASFVLDGVKLQGRFSLIRTARTRGDWLLIKGRDDAVVRGGVQPEHWAESVLSGRTLRQLIETEADPPG